MIANRSDSVRPAAVAGGFYSDGRKALENELSLLFERSRSSASKGSDLSGRIRALISPHAGYIYSGQTAAKTFALLENEQDYQRAVVLAPSHQVPFKGIALAGYSAYQTPLGDIEVDLEACNELSGKVLFNELDAAHEYEHALEVQLPFIQTLMPGIKIIPLICGGLTPEDLMTVAESLQSFWKDDILWVISSDFTHYGRSFGYLPFNDNIPENLRKLDMGAIEKITGLDTSGFTDYISDTGATICGAAPIRVLLQMIEIAGKENISASLVDYTNSGMQTGDYSHCVSYAGIVFRESE